MCGIAGFLESGETGKEKLKAITTMMTDRLDHRGPDDSGVWVDAAAGIALGHRRLSIIDLSPAGHQPMKSTSGRYVIAYNGEVYNFKEVRQKLEKQGIGFRGESDTEVLLTAIEAWGLQNAIKECVGMFAFALWDRKNRSLSLVRDRLGEKPAYFGWQGKSFIFASELKAMREHPDWMGEINRDALALFMRHNYVPAPYSIYKGIYKLQPGTILTLSANLAPGSIPEAVPYWSAKTVAEFGVSHPVDCSEGEVVDQLETLLRRSVREKMLADVPLGAFLSGGIDSSTVVAMMQAQSNRPVRTFSIGFHEEGYNEAEQAKLIAKHLGTEHTELYVEPAEAMDVIPRIPELYDEPFADSSQIPTFLVSALTRKHVTVSLSGDGGDELFGGYNRYFLGQEIWKYLAWMPSGVRGFLGRRLQTMTTSTLDKIYRPLIPFLPQRFRFQRPGDMLSKFGDILAVKCPEEMYLGLVSHWKNPAELVLGSEEPPTVLTDQKRWASLADFTQRMMFLDTISYLPDDIFAKVDRASMGNSLEVRVPFLDHRVVEYAWKIPLSMKIHKGKGKQILRRVLDKYVPSELMDQPKMGFGVPIDSWLRGPLRDWAEDLLDEDRIRREEFFDPMPIREKWNEHLSGKRNWQYYLWDVLMFQAWYGAQKV